MNVYALNNIALKHIKQNYQKHKEKSKGILQLLETLIFYQSSADEIEKNE